MRSGWAVWRGRRCRRASELNLLAESCQVALCHAMSDEAAVDPHSCARDWSAVSPHSNASAALNPSCSASEPRGKRTAHRQPLHRISIKTKLTPAKSVAPRLKRAFHTKAPSSHATRTGKRTRVFHRRGRCGGGGQQVKRARLLAAPDARRQFRGDSAVLALGRHRCRHSRQVAQRTG